MNNNFSKLDGTKVDLLEYLVDFKTSKIPFTLHIGTDSQSIGWKTQYSTVVVLRYNHKGGHILYQNNALKRISDMFTRLYKECELTLDTAQWIEANTAFKVDVVELDYNDIKGTGSNKLVSATKGWCESLGFKTNVKPETLIAIRAADYLCRGKQL